MAFSLKDLRERQATISFEFCGETVVVSYDPTLFTPAFQLRYTNRAVELSREIEDERESASKEKRPFNAEVAYRADVELMLMVVAGWNIEGLDDQPLPLDVDAVMEQMPRDMISLISNAVWDDVRNLGKSKPADDDGTQADR